MASDTGPFALVPEWLLDLPISDRSVRLYALLARHADKGTGECWPSRRSLSERLSCSVDSIDRATAELVDVGAVEKTARIDPAGDRTTNLYRVFRVRPGSREVAVTGGREVAAENESHMEREETHGVTAESEFESWWSLWPKRADKAQARKAYAARRRQGIEPDELALARDQYLAAHAGTEARYLKHAGTFLADSAGPWSEWLTPATLEVDVPARPSPLGPSRWVCGVGNPWCDHGNVVDPDAPPGSPVSRCGCVQVRAENPRRGP